MKHGAEDDATLREMLVNALAPCDMGSANEMLSSALLRLSYEQTLLTEYIFTIGDRDPLSNHILQGVAEGIAERARSLAALVATQLAVSWAPGKERSAES